MDRIHRILLVVPILSILCIPVAFAGAGAPRPNAGRIEELFPEDTVVFVSVEDITRAKADLAQTAGGAIWREEEVQAFLAKPLARLGELIGTFEQMTEIRLADVKSAFGGQVAVAVTKFAPGGPGGEPEIALVLAARVTDSVAANDLFALVTQHAMAANRAARMRDPFAAGWRAMSVRVDRKVELTIAMGDDLALVVIAPPGDDTVDSLVKADARPPARSLGRSREFRHVVRKLGPDRLCTFYVSFETIIAKVLAQLAEAPGPLAGLAREAGLTVPELARKALDSLGIAGLRSVGLSWRADPPGILRTSYVHAPLGPGEVRGAGERLSAETLALAPDDAIAFHAGTFPFSGIVSAIRKIAEVTGKLEDFEQGLAQVGLIAGFDIEKDLLGSLDDEVALITFASGVGGATPLVSEVRGTALVLKLRNAPAIERLLDRGLAIAGAILGANKAGRVEELAWRGARIRYVALLGGVVAPAFVVTDDWLVVAGSVAAAKEVVSLSKYNPRPLVESARFKARLARVGGRIGSSVGYMDTEHVVMRAASVAGAVTSVAIPALFAEGGRRARRQFRKFEEVVDLALVPSPRSYLKHLFPSVETTVSDDEGVTSIAYGPFGGFASPSLTNAAAVGGFGAGLLLPALASAREPARRAKCASNVKQLLLACHLWANDFDEKFPGTLEELFPRYMNNSEVFSCPTSPARMSYVFVSGVTSADPADWILIYELATNHGGDGVCVGYVGGNVQWQSDIADIERRVARQIEQARARGRTLRVIRPGAAATPVPFAPERPGPVF